MKLKNKRIIAAACSALICLQYAISFPVGYAAENSALRTYIMNDDPEKFKHLDSALKLALDSEHTDESEEVVPEEPTSDESEIQPTEPMPDLPPTSPEELIHDKDLNNYTIIEGIDVSKYQPNIDWEAVAADGIEFVNIRVGYRGYGSEGNIMADECFEKHINGALEAGLEVGVYFFTQAITEEEAIEEANFVLEQLDGYELDLPVYIDIENVSNAVGRLDRAKLSPEQHTANCTAFCETIKNAGYKAGIYANKYWLEEQLISSNLENKYPIWLARYNEEPEYQGEYQTWQYTRTGTVSGISGDVDRNCRYIRKTAFEKEQMIINRVGDFKLEYYGEGNIQFESSNTSVARVDEFGVVDPLKNGVTTITACSDNGSKATLEVIVLAFPSINLSQTILEFDELGVQKELYALNALTAVTWQSTQPDVIAITKDGKAETKGYGSALIIATNTCGNIGVCEVNVIQVIPGDCNNDGNVSALDAAELLIYTANRAVNYHEKLDERTVKRYDANGDGIINTQDAATILIQSASSSVNK